MRNTVHTVHSRH